MKINKLDNNAVVETSDCDVLILEQFKTIVAVFVSDSSDLNIKEEDGVKVIEAGEVIIQVVKGRKKWEDYTGYIIDEYLYAP